MTKHFEPFTPEFFKKETGFDAADNEAIYFRWVNSQINYANYKIMSEMSASLKQITQLLCEVSPMKELKL
jgi:hypothetical protein